MDRAFKKVTIQQIINSIKAAKEIYASTNVQINLLWIKTGKLDPRYFSIQANKIPEVPETEYVNMYQNMYRHPAVLGEAAKTAFKSIVEPRANALKKV